MRILMWLGIGLSVSMALCAYLLPLQALPAVIFVIACCSIASFLAGWKWRRLLPAAVLLLGAAAGAAWFLWFDTAVLAPARDLHEQVLEAQIKATDYPEQTRYGYRVQGTILLEDQSYKVQLSLKEDLDIHPGDGLQGTFRFRYTSPREGERASYNQGEGIFLQANQRGELRVLSGSETSWDSIPAILARGIQRLLEELFPEDAFPFAQALLLGEDSQLSYQQNRDFQITGIRHIIAVSGLHVSILYSVVAMVTFRRRFLTALVGIPVLILFAGVAGFTPSVNRACLMAGLMMAADCFQEEYDAPTALSFACIVMQMANPLVITSVSFQLSALCVAGILMFQEPIGKWVLNKLTREGKKPGKMLSGLAASAAMTLSSMVFTTPLTAIYFGTVSIIGVAANLLLLSVTNFLFVGIIGACAMGFLSSFLGKLAGWLLAWPIRYVLWISSLLAKVPLAALYTDSPYIAGWLLFCYCLLGVTLLSSHMGKKRIRLPAAFCCAWLGLCIAIGLSWLGSAFPQFRVTVMDVGQGQAILFQAEGKSFLIDCGGSSDTKAADTVAHRLYSQGIRRLDGIILTHGDADHAGGVGNLLTWVDADRILIPSTCTDMEFPENAGQLLWVDRQTEISFGDTSIWIYPPMFVDEDNDNSLCILLKNNSGTALITGDRSDWGERMLLKWYDIPDVDLLIAGHHGSDNSTGMALLQAVQPETVIVSAGRGNVYGHPGEEFLTRIASIPCQLFRTDQQGTIVYGE